MNPQQCDRYCQNEKKLQILKDASDKDPFNQDKAKAYFDLLGEQDDIRNKRYNAAAKEVDAVLKKYSDEYDEVKKELSANQALLDMTKGISSQEKETEANVQFLSTTVGKIKDKTDILNRQLNLSPPSPSYMRYIIDAVYLVLGLLILFLIFSKMDILKSYFTSVSQNVVPNMSGA